MKNKNGFTLAEIMITLGTLGIIAAILVPAVMSLVPDNNKILARKAYYTLEHVISQLSDDELHYPAGSTWSSNAGVISSCDNGMAVDCGFANVNTNDYPDIPASNNKFCYLFAQRVNLLGTATCTNPYSFTSSDGIYWKMYGVDSFPVSNTSYNAKVGIDVNGTTKGPNCYQAGNPNIRVWFTASACPTGKTADLYEFAIRYDGKIDILTGTTFLANPTKVTKE